MERSLLKAKTVVVVSVLVLNVSDLTILDEGAVRAMMAVVVVAVIAFVVLTVLLGELEASAEEAEIVFTLVVVPSAVVFAIGIQIPS